MYFFPVSTKVHAASSFRRSNLFRSLGRDSASVQVGSCQTDRVNHRLKDKVFHAGDVPRRAAEMRKEVQRSAKAHPSRTLQKYSY